MRSCFCRRLILVSCRRRFTSRLLANTLHITPSINIVNLDTRTYLTQASGFFSQRHNFCVSKVHRLKKDDGSYFTEFYLALQEQLDDQNFDVMTKVKKHPDDAAAQKRETNIYLFKEVVKIYKAKNPNNRKFVEFIYEALERMPEMGIHRDLSCYKELLEIFPKEVMVPTNMFQVEGHHFPKQHDCCVRIMDEMDYNGVMPDREVFFLIKAIHGLDGDAGKKIRAMMYWLPKFKHINPYPLPYYLPSDEIKMAILALRKMAIDLENEIKIWKVDLESSSMSTFIASAQSPEQRTLLSKHPCDVPLYVEGGFRVWLRDQYQTYFVLRADPDPTLFQYPTWEEQEEKLFDFETVFETEDPQELVPRPGQHQQEEGTILAMCITGTSTKDSLIMWIRQLQETNPTLENTNIVFTLKTEIPLVAIEGEQAELTVRSDNASDNEPEEKT